MRDFFKHQLKGLIVAGIRQMEYLDESQITELLNQLCIISEKKFNYIPIEVQKVEIRKQIIEDPEFNGLNTRWLFKTLTRISDKYWRTRSTITEEQLTPAPPEVAEKYIEEFKKQLVKVGGPKTAPLPINKILFGESESKVYKSEIDTEKHELHIQWIRENFDRDGNKLPGYISEEEFLKLKEPKQ